MGGAFGALNPDLQEFLLLFENAENIAGGYFILRIDFFLNLCYSIQNISAKSNGKKGTGDESIQQTARH